MAESRAPDREVGIQFRMSKAERARLKQEAAELGLSVQVLFEQRMLHKDVAADRVSGPRARDPELDLGMAM